jgi:hypothetical protein
VFVVTNREHFRRTARDERAPNLAGAPPPRVDSRLHEGRSARQYARVKLKKASDSTPAEPRPGFHQPEASLSLPRFLRVQARTAATSPNTSRTRTTVRIAAVIGAISHRIHAHETSAAGGAQPARVVPAPRPPTGVLHRREKGPCKVCGVLLIVVSSAAISAYSSGSLGVRGDAGASRSARIPASACRLPLRHSSFRGAFADRAAWLQ